jgi:hypothetical protein
LRCDAPIREKVDKSNLQRSTDRLRDVRKVDLRGTFVLVEFVYHQLAVRRVDGVNCVDRVDQHTVDRPLSA